MPGLCIVFYMSFMKITLHVNHEVHKATQAFQGYDFLGLSLKSIHARPYLILANPIFAKISLMRLGIITLIFLEVILD